MRVTITPSQATGSIQVPPSKSMAHRLLICAALSKGKSVINNVDLNEDIKATLKCLQALGAHIQHLDNTVIVDGTTLFQNIENPVLPCNESGSTLRFLIPLALLSGQKITFTGSSRLFERPLSIYEELFENSSNIVFSKKENLTVKGALPHGNFVIPGDVSSQFISGLLFALPLLSRDSKLYIEKPIESKSYIDMTLESLKEFGIKVDDSLETEQTWTLQIPGNQKYLTHDTIVEGDYSNAAFLDALNDLGGNVELQGLTKNSQQGDRVYPLLFDQIMDSANQNVIISLADCPDLAPICFAMAALSGKEKIIFTDTKRLAMKESDRATAMAAELKKCHVKVEVMENSVSIDASHLQKPTEDFFGHNDHRIVMALSILSTQLGGSIIGAEAVSKSYPQFFEDLETLGITLRKE